MNEAEFNQKVTATLLRIEQAVETSGTDIEFENAGDILTLEFADGSKIIITKQGATKQIWVAAKSGGYHYDYQATGDRWVNDQSGTELFKELSSLASRQAGETVDLA